MTQACIKCGGTPPDVIFPTMRQHMNMSRCISCSRQIERERKAGSGVSIPRVNRVIVSTEPEDTTGLYHTIVADPPWPLPQFIKTKTNPHPDKYPLLSLEEIAKHTPPARRQSHLYLWVLNQRVDWGYIIARAWGFEPMQMITWTKPGVGMGIFQCNTESFLVCHRGDPSNNTFNPSNGTYFYWPKGRHSEKPDHFYDLVNKMSPGPYLEMYARRTREGWDHWGNEVPDTGIKVGAYPPAPAQDQTGKPQDIQVSITIGKSAPILLKRA